MNEALALPKVTIQAKPEAQLQEEERTWRAFTALDAVILDENKGKIAWILFRGITYGFIALCGFNEMAYLFNVSMVHHSTLLKEVVLGPVEAMYDFAYGIIKHW